MTNRTKPIYVFIGTKAQYIKTAPLLRLMQKNGVDYRLIDSGQHADFVPNLRKELGIKEPNVSLSSSGNIKSVIQAMGWFAKHVATALLRPSALKRDIFSLGPGICIIHGDTPSTLLALLLAKRAGMAVAHLEAGLRSFNVMKPFPEELIRIITMRFSDYLFAPSDWAFNNLQTMKIKGKICNLGQNTNVEALYYSLKKNMEETGITRPYCLMTVHRVETILNRKRLAFVVELAENIAQNMRVIFILHDPTSKQLTEFGFIQRITENENIKTFNLIDHARFLQFLREAEFVITDGGSIQEETHYLDVPCLVMRSETERMEGIDTNVCLSNFDRRTIDSFLSDYKNFKRGEITENFHPSKQILEKILITIQ